MISTQLAAQFRFVQLAANPPAPPPPPPPSNAKYVRQGASGSGSGDDWTNAYSSIPSSLLRDYTYWFADGSYGSYTCDDALDGTKLITFQKATASAHGTETGWDPTYGDGQATFGTFLMNKGYYYINGVTRTETNINGAQPAGYGFRAAGVSADSLNGDNAAGSYFSYVDFGATWETNPSNATINGYSVVLRLVYNQANVTFNRCAIHNGKQTLAGLHGSDGIKFYYCDFALGWSKEAIAGMNVGINNMEVGWCRFFDSTQTDPNDPTSGITAEICATGGSNPTGNRIWSSTFTNTKSGGRNSCIAFGGMGWPDTAVNCLSYNNTFANIAEASVFSMVQFSGGSGNASFNSLYYGSASNGETANSTGNKVVASVDPFVSYGTRDFRITNSNQAVGQGTNLGGAPYNVDPLGVNRGGGAWDCGAYVKQP